MKLGKVVHKFRIQQELSLRVLAKDIGISTATLSRVERGEKMDGDTLSRLINWLMRETE